MKLEREGDGAVSHHSFIDYQASIARFKILSFGKGDERNSDFSVHVDINDVLRAITHMSSKNVEYATRIEALLRRDEIISQLFSPLDREREEDEKN
jgi:hypothetical protein